MGNFYATAVVTDASQDAVAAEVRAAPAYVSPALGRYVVVYPSLMAAGPRGFSSLWRDVSATLQVAVLNVAVFDDDVLSYELWVNGELKDQYVSIPAALDPDSPGESAQGGNPRVLCSVFKCADVARVADVLKAVRSDQRYLSETERHADLAAALGLPPLSVGCGYEYIQRRECPDGITQSELKVTGR